MVQNSILVLELLKATSFNQTACTTFGMTMNTNLLENQELLKKNRILNTFEEMSLR